MSVSKRTWRTVKGDTRQAWVYGYRDKDGKWRRVQRATRAAAHDERLRIEGELAKGVHVADRASITVRQATAAFLSDCDSLVRAGKRERSTYEAYRAHAEHHLYQHAIAGELLSRLTGPACNEFAAWLEATRSDDLARRVLMLLRMVLDHAITRGWCATNWAAGIKLRTAGERHDAETVFIPPKADLAALMATARTLQDNGRAEAMVGVMMFCGLRASELRGLRRQDVRLGRGAAELDVRQRADKWNKIGPVKSKAGRRTVPIPPTVAAALRRWAVAAPTSPELGLLFPNGRGRVEGYPNIWNRLWVPMMQAAGLVDLARRPAWGLHTLRHVAVSLWVEQGATPKWVSVKAGHRNIRFTLDTYGHLWPKPDDDAALAAKAEQSIFG